MKANCPFAAATGAAIDGSLLAEFALTRTTDAPFWIRIGTPSGVIRFGARVEVSDDRAAQQERVVDSATYLAENFEKVPVMMIPILPGRLDGLPSFAATSMLGSILPGAWSFMLAARSRGLGTAWTTLHLFHEEETAEVLGIPYAEVTQMAMVPVAHTVGTDFRPGARGDIGEVVRWDDWSERAEGA